MEPIIIKKTLKLQPYVNVSQPQPRVRIKKNHSLAIMSLGVSGIRAAHDISVHKLFRFRAARSVLTLTGNVPILDAAL